MPKIVDADERREQLTDAAARVIARSGIEAATMREVAAEAGWTTGTLTHYFDDKRALLLATFQASLARRRSLRAPADASPRSRLRRSLEGALPSDDDRRRHWLVTLTCCTMAQHDTEVAAAQTDAYREFRDHVASLVEAAELVPADRSVHEAERLIAVVDGLAIQSLFDPASWPPARQLHVLRELLPAVY